MDFKRIFRSIEGFWKDKGPQVMVYTGVVGLIGAGVLACIETTSVQPILDDHKARKEKEGKTVKVYAKTAGKLAKHYAPSLAIGVLSATGICVGTNILVKTVSHATAAYMLEHESFNAYRKAVVEKYGEDEDERIRKGIHKVEVQYDDGTSEEFDVVDDLNFHDQYIWIFKKGESSIARESVMYNLSFLMDEEASFNADLKYYHIVYLNDVLKRLGFKLSPIGGDVGWVYDLHSDEFGDNYIKFHPKEVKWLNPDSGEYENVIALEFNVDGAIKKHAQALGIMESEDK